MSSSDQIKKKKKKEKTDVKRKKKKNTTKQFVWRFYKNKNEIRSFISKNSSVSTVILNGSAYLKLHNDHG